jgi:hypothetical protein
MTTYDDKTIEEALEHAVQTYDLPRTAAIDEVSEALNVPSNEVQRVYDERLS